MTETSHDRLLTALYALCSREGGYKHVAAAAGISADNLRQILQGAKLKSGQPRSLGRDLQDRLTRRFPDWLNPQTPSAGDSAPRGTVAHVLIHHHASDAPLVPWEVLMRGQSLPQRFVVEVPDDSMLPRVKRGDRIEFDAREAPRSGDGVLVRDDHGRLYFRVYRQARPDHWEAHPLNTDYLPLRSDADGLKVVAVMIGAPRHRWG